MKIIIGADFVPTKSNAAFFAAGNIEELLGTDLVSELRSADYRIFNLETPLADKETPIQKCGPNLVAGTDNVKGYTAAGVDLVTIANNHILDQGYEGLQSTCSVLEKNGIAYVGVGNNCKEASKPFYFEVAGKRVGVYGCVEHEFSVATEHAAGANPYDPLESFDHVQRMKEQCDYAIVLYHGGKELYQYPSPILQRTCRKFIEKGANLVICQHSHCLGCKEEYSDGTIIYGQGNFLFDDSENKLWKTAVLVCLNDDWKVSYVPIVKKENGVRLASSDEAASILAGFNSRSEEIKTEIFVESKYQEFADGFLPWYFYSIGGFWRSMVFRVYSRVFHKKPNIAKWYGEKKIDEIINCIDDEAHRELLLAGLKGSK